MPDEPADPLIAAARTIAAADRAGRINGLRQLSEWAAKQNRAVPAFQALLRAGSPKLALEFLVRYPGEMPRSLVLLAAPLLPQNDVPVGVRLQLAAKFLSILPDRREAVGPIVRAATAGLNRRRTLQRLIALQNRVEACTALDAIVADTEAKVRFPCPVCKKSFHRPALFKHLWKKHRIDGAAGKPVPPAAVAEQLVEAAKSDVTALDRAFLLTPRLFPKADVASVFQGLASRHWRSSDQYADLADRAADRHAGLCPKCYGPVADAIPELPPPLLLGHGRLSGDGYVVELSMNAGYRRVRIEASDGVRVNGGDRPHRLSPRVAASLFALPVAVIGLLAVSILPPVKPDSWSAAIWFTFATIVAYIGLWAWRKPLPPADDRCVDLAWSMLAPGIGRNPAAVHYLARLCRTSFVHGDAAERSTTVWELAEHAAVLSEKGGPYVALFAAASVLRAVDAGTLGRDTIGELASLVTGVFRRELTAPVVELMAKIVIDDVPLDAPARRRLGILIAAAGFDAGLTPTDLASLRRYLPSLVALLPGEGDHLAALYAVWQQRSEKLWAKAGDADTIFAACKQRPSQAMRVLKADPDALIVAIPEDFLYDLLGPITVNRKGVRFGGASVADPAAEVTVVTTHTGGELTFGKNSFALERRPNDAIEKTLKRLLRYRAEQLIPEIDDGATVSGTVETFLDPLRVACPLCRTSSLIRTGQLGVA
jgi:hypothetical protein